MKFKQTEDEDENNEDIIEEKIECIEVVSTTWVSKDQNMCFWPPESIPMDRAGRMATSHSKPDPKTWQYLPITFIKSYSMFMPFNFNVLN